MELAASRLHPRKTSPATRKKGQHRADQWYSARMTIGLEQADTGKAQYSGDDTFQIHINRFTPVFSWSG